MRGRFFALTFLFITVGSWAAAQSRVIRFGEPIPVKLFIGPTDDKTMDMKIRGLYVDGNLKEFTTGEAHDITGQLFVTRKAYRLNGNLPEDTKSPRWKWQRGGWLLVDRTNGHISTLKLPEFDPFYSNVSWYRDYAAYCGISDDGDKLYAVVAEIGQKKAVLLKEFGPTGQGDTPESECDAPQWDQNPAQVTFVPKKFPKVSFTLSGHTTDQAGKE